LSGTTGGAAAGSRRGRAAGERGDLAKDQIGGAANADEAANRSSWLLETALGAAHILNNNDGGAEE
jgi:hypothetical protein